MRSQAGGRFISMSGAERARWHPERVRYPGLFRGGVVCGAYVFFGWVVAKLTSEAAFTGLGGFVLRRRFPPFTLA